MRFLIYLGSHESFYFMFFKNIFLLFPSLYLLFIGLGLFSSCSLFVFFLALVVVWEFLREQRKETDLGFLWCVEYGARVKFPHMIRTSNQHQRRVHPYFLISFPRVRKVKTCQPSNKRCGQILLYWWCSPSGILFGIRALNAIAIL